MRRIPVLQFVSLLIVFAIGSGLFGIAGYSPVSAATSVTIHPIADAYVVQTSATTNYGTGPTLRVDNNPNIKSYLRFNITNLSGITAAKLRLYSNSSSTSGITVKTESNDNWGETTLTYANAPAAGSSLDTSAAVKKGTWISMNVSAYVTGNGMWSFVVSTPGSTAISLAARESGANAPQLIITTGSSPTLTPTTVNPTQTPTQNPTSTPTPVSGTDWQPAFPIRAAFYYPWFPEAWTQLGIYPYTNYNPTLDFYSSADQSILKQHIAMMQYGHIEAAIASWWGQGSQTDTKIAGLLTAAAGTNFRWALYYENESMGNPTVSQIQSDLVYIHDHYGQNPNFLRVNGKFVVFVYADGSDACGMADRWKQANTVNAYVVLKVFPGYATCTSQPDAWHQYSPAVAEDQQGSLSFAISPGFWLKGNAVRLSRDLTRWAQNVKDMVASGARWQLITTFSEWGEGTAVEPATQWASASGFGQYLDVLHDNP